ncbi:MAG: hypothetical protein Q9171_007408 [Xanthocarpia ochracea]
MALPSTLLKTPDNKPSRPSFEISLDSPALDEVDCSPATRSQLLSLKRKASALSEQGSPCTTAPFLDWRLAVINSTLDLRRGQRQALAEASPSYQAQGMSKAEIVAVIGKDEKSLREEKAVLMSSRKMLEGDLNDLVTSKDALADAYIEELRMSLHAASSSKEKYPGKKTPRLDRKAFATLVNEYLETTSKTDTGAGTPKYCNVLGFWLPSDSIKCAHIIPFSWNTKDMAHIFGSDESPLTSKRNGLSLQTKIEQAFDDCWVTVVPSTTVETTPTKWKLVVLNAAIMDNIFFTDYFSITSQRFWRWKDIHNRELSFLNNNRPARRFLYLRYTLAWLHANDNNWPGFKEIVPPGTVWASPNKPDGYLRKSILVEIGRRTGDKLPNDLIEAGAFEDPDSSSKVADEVACIRVTEKIEDHLSGDRDPKSEDEDEDDEETGKEASDLDDC